MQIIQSFSKENICRIWLDSFDPESDSNPLISPCEWSGSMKHIHLEWLQTWVNETRKVRETGYVTSYYWRNLEWELCKSLFLLEFIHKGKVHRLLHYDVDESKAYIILEAFCIDASKTMHVLSIDESNNNGHSTKVYIGRVLNLDIRINDLSVSRLHSRITFSDGNFYIWDMGSKYGTCVRLSKPIVLPPQYFFCVYFLVGSTILAVTTKFWFWDWNIFNKKRRVSSSRFNSTRDYYSIDNVPSNFK